MWQNDFTERLRSWSALRDRAKHSTLEHCLVEINDWWFRCPWRPYYLHWDDAENWPDPWTLLADNIFCDLARALGMYYTISMLEHKQVNDFVLAETNQGNLVLINHGKYILNWKDNKVLNIEPQNFSVGRQLDSGFLQYTTGKQ